MRIREIKSLKTVSTADKIYFTFNNPPQEYGWNFLGNGYKEENLRAIINDHKNIIFGTEKPRFDTNKPYPFGY